MTQELYHVRIYMRSGNVIDLKNLTKFNFTKNGGKFTELTWEVAEAVGENLLTLDLNQIEAITQIFKE